MLEQLFFGSRPQTTREHIFRVLFWTVAFGVAIQLVMYSLGWEADWIVSLLAGLLIGLAEVYGPRIPPLFES